MTGAGSPCGACKFLRRKCARGCVFAPYFCEEQGAAHFAAIHRVFGASNVSKLLAQLPAGDRAEAAVTIAYEAQARLEDPIYGCVSHIFALQHQVMNLQAQLASLMDQAAQTFINPPNCAEQSKLPNRGTAPPRFDSSCSENNHGPNGPYFSGSTYVDYDPNINPIKYESYPGFPEDNASFGSMDSIEMQCSNELQSPQWPYQNRDDAEDLSSFVFGYNS